MVRSPPDGESSASPSGGESDDPIGKEKISEKKHSASFSNSGGGYRDETPSITQHGKVVKFHSQDDVCNDFIFFYRFKYFLQTRYDVQRNLLA